MKKMGVLVAFFLASCGTQAEDFPQLVLRCSSEDSGKSFLPIVDISILTDKSAKAMYFTTITKNIAARSNSVKMYPDRIEASMTDVQSGSTDDLKITYEYDTEIATTLWQKTNLKTAYKCTSLPETSFNSEMMAMDMAFREIKMLSETYIN